MISKSELLKGRDQQYASEYTPEISDNLDRLLGVMNQVREAYALPMIVTSGWRPAEINKATPGAATNSKHMIGLACDILDDGPLMRWILAHLSMMQELGLYFEDFRWCNSWCHFQLGPPVSGKRIFIPSTTRPRSPDRWDGKYDRSFDVMA